MAFPAAVPTLNGAVQSSEPRLVVGACEQWASRFRSALSIAAADPILGGRSLRVAASDTPTFSGMMDRAEHVAMSLRLFYRHVCEYDSAADPLRDTQPHQFFYLSQCPLDRARSGGTGAELPELFSRDMLPAWAFSAAAYTETNLWMGAGAVSSSMHYDCEHNLLCCVAGRKRVVLVAPDARGVGAQPLHGESHHHASLDLMGAAAAAADSGSPSLVTASEMRSAVLCIPSPATHPGLANIDAVIVDLLPGDGLFIPEGWWHAVHSAPHTIAVNFWWAGLRAAVCQQPQASYLARSLLRHLADDALEKQREACIADSTGRLARADDAASLAPLLWAVREEAGGSTECAFLYGRAVRALLEPMLPPAQSATQSATQSASSSAGVDGAARVILDAADSVRSSSGCAPSASAAAQLLNDVFIVAPSAVCLTALRAILEGGADQPHLLSVCFSLLEDSTLEVLTARWEAGGMDELGGDAEQRGAFFTQLWGAVNASAVATAAPLAPPRLSVLSATTSLSTITASGADGMHVNALAAGNELPLALTDSQLAAGSRRRSTLFPAALQAASEALRARCLREVVGEVTGTDWA